MQVKGQFFIREMRNDDYDSVAEIWKETEGIVFGEADSRENISRYLKHNPGSSFVAVDGKTIVGTVLCGHDCRRGYLHHLAVKEEYRRVGLGYKLVTQCLEKLKTLGIKKCHVFVLFDNVLGQKYWESAGWGKRNDIFLYSINI